ncbi:MAG: CARDB domain-containing protein, partial [Candidatus Bathyarchaeia archaeon]
PGVYFIKAFADSSREITEYNEDNNNCTSTEYVAIVVPPGVLDVDKVLSRVVYGPSPAVVGKETTYEILITVANTGGSPIENVNVTDTINEGEISSVETPSLGEITSWNSTTIVWYVGDLGVGQSANLTFTIRFKPSESGIHVLNYGDKLVAEGEGVSDTGDRDITVTAVIRDVAAISQTPLKYVVIKGELIGVDVVVKNLGDYYNETFDVVCYYNDTPIQPISLVRVLDLEPGEERTVRFIWDTSGVDPGVYFIKAFADSSREITEYNEDNNNCTSTEYVEIIVHDIAAVSQIPYPTRVVQGESVTIEVTIRNEGTEYESFTLKCYYYNETAEIPMELGERSVSLDPGSEKIEYFIWDTTGIPPAIYYIEARAIPVEGELDTDDNTCMSQVNVTITVASISGYKWNDIDGDGEWDVAEPPLQNWNITLYKLIDSSWVYQTSVLTDEDGYYEFTDLAAGTYRVCEVLEDGWICTYPPDGYYEFTVTVEFDGTDKNFGNFKKATIIVWKYEDEDGNPDTTDDWIPIDWTITLFNDTYPSGQSFSLDSDGMIIFDGQGPGVVAIMEHDIPGWIHMNSTNTWTQSMESGGTYIIRFVNTRVRGYIIVRKLTVSGDQSFEFTTSYSTNFFLSNGQENVSQPLIPGNYVVTELPVDGWSLTSIDISDPDGGSSYDLATGTAIVDLDAGETIYVTFTNTKYIPPPVGGIIVIQTPLQILLTMVATVVAIVMVSIIVLKKLRIG